MLVIAHKKHFGTADTTHLSHMNALDMVHGEHGNDMKKCVRARRRACDRLVAAML